MALARFIVGALLFLLAVYGPDAPLAFFAIFAGESGVAPALVLIVHVLYLLTWAVIVTAIAYLLWTHVALPTARLYRGLTYPERAREARLYPELHTEAVASGAAAPARVHPTNAPTPPASQRPDPAKRDETPEKQGKQPANGDPREDLPDIQAVPPPPDDQQGERAWERLILPGSTKDELRTVQKLLLDPGYLHREWGAEFNLRGIILSGPPGTGKTTIAKAIAASAGFSFYAIDPATIKSMWMGQSEKTIQKIYATARQNAPAIVFLDEIDAIASARSSTSNDLGGGARSSNATVNQLLTEIDGFQTDSGGRVFTVAATNRADALDAALKSRLNYNLSIPLPEASDRRQLFELYFHGIIERGKLDVPIDELVARSQGMSGRDIKNIADAIPQIAYSTAATTATPAVIDLAFERVLRPDEERGNYR